MNGEEGTIIQELIGNGILGIILAWFMVQHAKLIERVIEVVKKNSESFTKISESLTRSSEINDKLSDSIKSMEITVKSCEKKE